MIQNNRVYTSAKVAKARALLFRRREDLRTRIGSLWTENIVLQDKNRRKER